MSSLIYNSFWDDALRALINLDSGGTNFSVILLKNTYVADATAKTTHLNRGNIGAVEVDAGAGYTQGGAANTVTVTVTKGTGGNGFAVNTIGITLGGKTWTTGTGQTLTARHALWFLNTGTAANDRLIAVNDFGSDQIASNGGTLTLPNSTITLTNT